jgi:hypothetical protein
MSSLTEDMLVQISGIQGTLSRVLLKDNNYLSLSAIYTTKIFYKSRYSERKRMGRCRLDSTASIETSGGFL